MRIPKLAIPVAVIVLIGVIGVGASLAQTETPVPPAPESTEAPAATPSVASPRGGFGMGGMMMMQGGFMDVVNVALDAIAAQTGLTHDEIIAAVHSGQTVADLVKSKNGDVQVVIDATVKAATDKITAAVTAGTLKQAQADRLIANLTQIVTDAVNGKLPMMGGFGPMSGRPGMGGGFGPQDNQRPGRPGMGGGFGPWNWDNQRPGRGGGFGPWNWHGRGFGFGPGNGPRGNWGGPGMNGFNARPSGIMGMTGNDVLMTAISSAIDMRPQAIMRELRGGKTLADVITENGGSVDAVISSAVAAQTDFLNGFVELGRISREDADKQIAGLKDQFTQALNATMNRRGGNHDANPMTTPEATSEAASTPSV